MDELSRVRGLLRALRPRQWIRNALVFLPLVFAVNLVWSPEDLASLVELLLRAAVTAGAFCALSGAVCLFNDLMDRLADREHPVKRFRPIASGRVGVPLAFAMMGVLLFGGVFVLVLISELLGGIGFLYVSINLAYSVVLKRVVLVDLLLLASGYVLRVVAGALAIGVLPSPWLYTTTAAAALFIVLGQRYAELRAQDGSEVQCLSLRQYPAPFVGQLLTVAATAALVSYTVYTVVAANLPDNNVMLLTVPLVAFGLFRFLYLVHTSDAAEYPEALIVRDLPMVLSIVVWLGAASLILLLNPGAGF